MNTTHIMLLTIPVDKKQKVWIGIPSYLPRVGIGIQFEDRIWEGFNSPSDHDEYRWPSFIHQWYVAQVYKLCLEQCKDPLMSPALLSASAVAFRPYDCSINPGLLAKYVSKEDIKQIRNEIPPLDYIIDVINRGKEQRLLFDEQLTREFLVKHYYINEQVNNALHTLKEYKLWRDELAKRC